MIHQVGNSCLDVVRGLLHCFEEFISPLRNKSDESVKTYKAIVFKKWHYHHLYTVMKNRRKKTLPETVHKPSPLALPLEIWHHTHSSPQQIPTTHKGERQHFSKL